MLTCITFTHSPTPHLFLHCSTYQADLSAAGAHAKKAAAHVGGAMHDMAIGPEEPPEPRGVFAKMKQAVGLGEHHGTQEEL